MEDQSGITHYTYDDLNRLEEVSNPDGKKIIYGYDANSNRETMYDLGLGTTGYKYDNLNRLYELTDPQEGVTEYEYDDGGRLTGMRYPNGATAGYKYDNGDRITSLTHKLPDGSKQSFSYTYDKVGNRLTMVDSTGKTIYSYDKLYRLKTVDYPSAPDVTYTYDKVGNRLAEKLRDENGNEGTGIYSTYNELNQLTARGQSSPGDPTLVTNIKGDVSDVDHLGAAAQVDSVAVNGVAAQVYPNVGRFKAEGVTLQPGLNIITATARDLAGNTATATITTTLLSGEPITYEYDRNGCLTKKTVPEVGETIYEYDFENRLTKVTLPGGATNEFAYDGDKRRISKKNAAGEVTKFLYDGINILKDYDKDGRKLAYYVQGIGIDKLIKRGTPDGSEYYHSDALGSVRVLTDEAGNQVGTYEYDAWGKITGSTGQSSNEYKFTSRRWEEEIGLQYNRARFYDPETGRFTTPDPLTGGPDDPTISYFSGVYSQFHRFIKEYVDALQPDKHNRYVYCYNNPVNLTDPLGLQAEEDQTAEVQVEAEKEKAGEKKAETAGQVQETGTEQKGETADDVKQKEEVEKKPATVGETREKIENHQEGKGVWEIAKDVAKYVVEGMKDWLQKSFEGSQYGGGAGIKAKSRIGPVKVELGMEAIEGTRVTREGLKGFYEEKVGGSLQLGPWKPTISFEESGAKFKPLEFEAGGLSIKSLTTIEIGATIPNPASGAAINLELHIHIDELLK